MRFLRKKEKVNNTLCFFCSRNGYIYVFARIQTNMSKKIVEEEETDEECEEVGN